VRVVARDAVRELVQVGLADVDVPGRLEPRDRLGGALGHVVGEQDGAVGGTQTGRVEEVLHGQTDPLPDLLRPSQKDGHAATLIPIASS
jgi:hypothetical protein